MNAKDILLLGLKGKVTALAKADGRQLWATELKHGGMVTGDGFVSLMCDDARVYAYSAGRLHCLELASGRLLWTNELRGYGFGTASLCVPGFGSAPDAVALKRIMDQQNSAGAASGS